MSIEDIYLNRTLATTGSIFLLNKKDEAPIKLLYENNTIIFIINNVALDFKSYLNWNDFVDTMLLRKLICNEKIKSDSEYAHHINLRDIVKKEQVTLLVFTFKDFSLLKFDDGPFSEKNFLIDSNILKDLKIPYGSK